MAVAPSKLPVRQEAFNFKPGAGGNVANARVVQTVMYAFGPFFGYPWKPPMNALAGGDYLGSYKHFRAQHMDGTNLFLHCLCLCWQLSSNYALLDALDESLVGASSDSGPKSSSSDSSTRRKQPRLLSLATSIIWSIHLLRTRPTPLSVKLASVVSIFLAHNLSADFWERHWRKIMFFQGFIEAASINMLILKQPSPVSIPSVTFFSLRTALWALLSRYEGVLAKYSKQTVALLLLFITATASSKKDALAKTVTPLSLFGWIFALLTGEKSIYLWSCGATASIAQGLAHAIAGEAGTLVVLQEDQLDQTRYELSHVTYFPNLLFQSVHAHVQTWRS